MIVALDFDGVIHSYKSKWIAEHVIPDPPVDGALGFIKSLIENRIKVVIFSMRCKTLLCVKAMLSWLLTYGLPSKYVELIDFSFVKPHAELYIDDRGFQFSGNFPTIKYIKEFKPWNK